MPADKFAFIPHLTQIGCQHSREIAPGLRQTGFQGEGGMVTTRKNSRGQALLAMTPPATGTEFDHVDHVVHVTRSKEYWSEHFPAGKVIG
jgi:hypothetical protein